MVIIRAPHTQLATGGNPLDNAGSSSALRQEVSVRHENWRRAALYDVSSLNQKQFPKINLPSADVRVRRDLLRLIQQQDQEIENDEKDCKHHDHFNIRPPTSHVNQLNYLQTVRVESSLGQKTKPGFKSLPEWRLGYNNKVDSSSRAGVKGIFEPPNSTRECIPDGRAFLPRSVMLAYPLQESNDPFESNVNNQTDDITNDRKGPKKPWCPGSKSSPFSSHSFQTRVRSDGIKSKLQRNPIRHVESFEQMERNKVDTRCAHKHRALFSKVAGMYARVRTRMDRLKDPQLRYKLPVENARQHPRAYRLGLAEVPSSTKEEPKIRPRSVGLSLGFQTGRLSPSKAGDLLTEDHGDRAKVAGARRRPHSASVIYLTHSTCMRPAISSKYECLSGPPNFGDIIEMERQKRKRERDSVFQELSKRGLLHAIPLAQVFARLRREGLLNIDRQQRNTFERITLDEYMKACGCLKNSTAPPSTLANSMSNSSRRFSGNTSNKILSETVSPSLIATRNALAVSRQQFHLALEAFSLSPKEVSLFFSALDLTVSDLVYVWDAICAVEMLQQEHTALRRGRVQQLQAPPRSDLGLFRQNDFLGK